MNSITNLSSRTLRLDLTYLFHWVAFLGCNLLSPSIISVAFWDWLTWDTMLATCISVSTLFTEPVSLQLSFIMSCRVWASMCHALEYNAGSLADEFHCFPHHLHHLHCLENQVHVCRLNAFTTWGIVSLCGDNLTNDIVWSGYFIIVEDNVFCSVLSSETLALKH